MSKYPLSQLISSKTGMSLKKYAEERLNCGEKLMYYRIRSGKIPLKDVSKIMKDTGCSFDELFGDIISNLEDC